MDFEAFRKYEPLYVIGHQQPDVDSTVSTIILTNVFKSKGIDCHSCFLKTNYEIDEYNRKMIDDCMDLNVEIIDDDDYNYVLVDHNDPVQSVGFGKKIVWGIDHHRNANILSNIYISNSCSCSLAIYNYFKDQYHFSNEEKFMIYMASLADCLFFKGSRYTVEDRKLIDELGYDLDANAMFKKYFIPTDLSVGFETLLNSKTKTYNYNGVVFDSVVIKTYNQFEERKQEFIEEIKKKNNFLGIWIDLDKEISYAYFNHDGTMKNFIYDFLASRAATVIPDVFKYLDRCDELKNKKEF